jgi:hypothetical protein
MKPLQTIIACVLGGMTPLVPFAAAQGEPGEAVRPAPVEAERRVPRVPGEIEAFSPVEDVRTSPVRPGLSGGAPWDELSAENRGPRRPRTLAERTFVNRIRGVVLDGPHGTRVFVPAASETGLPAAMLLLPCGVLERFDEFVFKRESRVPAVVSGQMFLYNARNYLLPTAVLAAADGGVGTDEIDVEGLRGGISDVQDSDRDGSGPDAALTSAPTAGSDGGVREAEIADLIGELERTPVYSRRRRGDREPTGQPATPWGEPEAANVTAGDGTPREERYLASRRGRVVRSADGSWVFVADNDGQMETRMVLLPCRLLQAVEGIALREGDDAAVLLSGRVFRYHGQDYLLPTLFQRERRDGVDPLQ